MYIREWLVFGLRYLCNEQLYGLREERGITTAVRTGCGISGTGREEQPIWKKAATSLVEEGVYNLPRRAPFLTF